MVNPFVSVIIPTYNDWARLSVCLGALVDQTYPRALFEVLIVNNNPEDKMPEGYVLPENCEVLTESKPGSYAARNAALKVCKGEIIGFTDSDCIPDKDWIKNAVAFFGKHTEVQRLGGGIHVFFKKTRPSKFEFYDKFYAFPQESYVKAGNAVTANMFAYFHVFKEVGFFDPRLMSGGDYQWGMMAQKKGFPIAYAPQVRVDHPARASLKELIIKAKRVGKGQANLHDYVEQNFFQRTWELVRLLKPRTWEIKRVFKEGGDLSMRDKIFLILLRHYIIWVGVFALIKNRKGRNLPA